MQREILFSREQRRKRENSKMSCGVKNLLRNVITFVLAVVLIMSVVPPADAQAAKVKNGLRKASNGYYYCYKNGSMVRRSGWVKVNDNLKVKLGTSYKVQYRQTNMGDKTYISKFDSAKKKFIRLDRTYTTLSDKKLHFVSKNGVLVRKKTTVSAKNGNVYFVEKGGAISRRYIKKTKRLYKYDYANKKWVLQKNTSCKINGKTYYFDKNGKMITRKAPTEAPSNNGGDPGPADNVFTSGRNWTSVTDDLGRTTVVDQYGYYYNGDGSYMGDDSNPM